MLKEHYFFLSHESSKYTNILELMSSHLSDTVNIIGSQEELYRSVMQKGYLTNSIFVVFCEDNMIYNASKFLCDNLNVLNFILIGVRKGTVLKVLSPNVFDYINLDNLSDSFALHVSRLKGELSSRHRISLLQNEVQEFYEIGKSLSSQKDAIKLLEMIVQSSIKLTSSDGGTIYLVVDAETEKWTSVKQGDTSHSLLKFVIAKNMSLEVKLESSTSELSTQSISGYCVVKGHSLRIDDVYDLHDSVEYRHNKLYDQTTGYRTKSMLAIPMKDHENNILGVIQLINKKKDKNSRINFKDHRCLENIIPFDPTDELLMNSLAGQAAVAISNTLLYRDMQDLLEDYKRQNNELSLLTTRVLRAHEEERKRIAREIHDGPAQSAASLAMKVEIIRKYISLGDQESVLKQLDELSNNIRSTVIEIRGIIYDLKPSFLDDGLVKAVENYLTVFNKKTGLAVFLQKDGYDSKVEYYLTSTLYRIIQEALSNIYKHAKATQVGIDLNFGETMLIVRITDNGKGFDVDSAKSTPKSMTGGFGLEGIRERVELVRGNFDIISETGKGTVLEISVPL